MGNVTNVYRGMHRIKPTEVNRIQLRVIQLA
jgi:hypothetical protein